MLPITLQTNSITFLSGILLQEIVFELYHSAFAWDTQDVCKSIIKHLKHEVMPTPTRTPWSQIVNDFWDLSNFLNCVMSTKLDAFLKKKSLTICVKYNK